MPMAQPNKKNRPITELNYKHIEYISDIMTMVKAIYECNLFKSDAIFEWSKLFLLRSSYS